MQHGLRDCLTASECAHRAITTTDQTHRLLSSQTRSLLNSAERLKRTRQHTSVRRPAYLFIALAGHKFHHLAQSIGQLAFLSRYRARQPGSSVPTSRPWTHQSTRAVLQHRAARRALPEPQRIAVHRVPGPQSARPCPVQGCVWRSNGWAYSMPSSAVSAFLHDRVAEQALITEPQLRAPPQ